MKRLARRSVTLALLIIGALLWVALLSLPFGSSGRSQGSDGATGRVTLIDKSAFPKVSSYLALKDAAGQPITGLQATNFSLTEDGVPVPFDFTGAGEQPLTTILVIDHSGSMRDFNKMQGAQQAADTFVNLLRPGRDSLGVIVFDNTTTELVPLAPLAGEADKQQAEAAVGQVYPAGGTLLYDALVVAIQRMQGTNGRRVVIALTDGISDNGKYSQSSITTLAKSANIPIYTIGLGQDVRGRDLASLAKDTGGEYAFAPGAPELQSLYTQLAKALQNEYRFMYTSPTAHLDGTRRIVAITAKRSAGSLLTSGDYAVSGVLVLNRSPFLLLLLTGVLLGMAGAPAVFARVRRTIRKEQTTAGELPQTPGVMASELTPILASQEPIAAHKERPFRAGESIHEPIPMSRSAQLRKPAPSSPVPPIVLPYTLPLTGERTTIGSAPTNTISLQGLAPHQVTILQRSGQWVIEPLAGVTLVSFNGQTATERPIVNPNALKQGSTIRLDGYLAIFEAGERPGLTFVTCTEAPFANQGMSVK